ncbi:MAG: sulfur oxidation c-type cytochrome SoxA [Hyphomonadaceae bacterium]|nr:sulfur oxidation c-type cytochrome SoxA [Hyphomonadaceae bacterium]
MDLPRGVVRSGYEFLQPETRILQDDDFENPGLLWVQQGAVLFETPMQGGPACASCHGEGGRLLTGAAAHYPAMESQSGELVNLEGRINLCRERYQGAPALAYESSELLALTAYTASLARGMEQSVNITGAAAPYYDAGRAYFFARKGQYNLSCHQCHDENWGRQLRGDTISQGHGNAFPAYRLEWQDFGSLHRRLRDCDSGIRAEPLPYGSETYVAVELYLAKRAEGLVMESPGVRR